MCSAVNARVFVDTIRFVIPSVANMPEHNFHMNDFLPRAYEELSFHISDHGLTYLLLPIRECRSAVPSN